MITRLLALIAIGVSLAGCASAAKSYADKHPELTPAQRQIFLRGAIPSGDAVAGLTREQVRLVMGREPTTYDKANGEDVWIFARKQMVGRDSFDDMERSGTATMADTRSFTQTADFTPHTDTETKTSVFFTGNRASHAQVTNEP